MQFYYGDQNYLRVLDEVEFWKRQEAEHTTVIQEVVSNLDAATINQLKKFELKFNQTEQKAVQLIETVVRSQGQINQSMTQYIMEFTRYAIQESEQFVQFLNDLLTRPQLAKDLVGKVVVNHIIRESEYFIGIAQTIMYQC
ncbi:MAG TPA: DUF2935 domain-containing protein [Clostridiales bacterium]|nr:DUF2935 domain-containing protein [Clostridiales bacterium]